MRFPILHRLTQNLWSSLLLSSLALQPFTFSVKRRPVTYHSASLALGLGSYLKSHGNSKQNSLQFRSTGSVFQGHNLWGLKADSHQKFNVVIRKRAPNPNICDPSWMWDIAKLATLYLSPFFSPSCLSSFLMIIDFLNGESINSKSAAVAARELEPESVLESGKWRRLRETGRSYNTASSAISNGIWESLNPFLFAYMRLKYMRPVAVDLVSFFWEAIEWMASHA